MKKLTYVFVHGLSGWGSYDARYRAMPYWGMRGGDLISFLRSQGFDCYAASVAPTGSAWDRACELYAQLAGTRVDYGAVHSRKYGHAQYGRDFSPCPLIPALNEDSHLVLLGHSFGGATVRLFAALMANGDADERKETPQAELSPFFAGVMGGRIHSIVTLASPMNGTTAYDLAADPSFDASKIHIPWRSRLLARLMSLGTKPDRDDRDPADYADWDMHIDNAQAMNRRMKEQPEVYYYSVPCSCTVRQLDGTYMPDTKRMEPLFIKHSILMGHYTGRTADGMEIGQEWLENDGLVNTISAAYPIGAPHQVLDKEQIRPGIWNVFPTVDGDHMSLQGGLTHQHDIREFYREMLTMISRQGTEKQK